MEYVLDFFSNHWLISAIIAWFIAQLIKLVTAMIREKKLNVWPVFFSNGGMPSSHSSSVCALATATVIHYGIASFESAIALVFAMVVMTDASGVRWETGEQAKILNRITKELFSKDPEMVNTGLKELVGHTPFQVLMGALLGIFVSVGFHLLVT